MNNNSTGFSLINRSTVVDLQNDMTVVLSSKVVRVNNATSIDKTDVIFETKTTTREDPAYNMRYIHKIVNCSPLDDEKRFKIIRKMYGKKRFVDAVGAAMTIDANNSDFITYLVEYVMKMKKTKKRAPYLLAYANAFKTNKTTNFRLINEKFYRKNKKLIKELVNEVDIKYKKAFKQIKHSKDKNADKIMKKNKKKAKEAEKEEKKLKKDTTITI